jgi:ABC-type nitrate/sulfonate/bicarbonate transport system substrate-binding protein
LAASRREFNAVLSEAVDEGLKAVLGETGREVVYYHLQSVYGLRKEGISEHPEILIEFLNKLFGAGAEIIERAILKKLCLKLGIRHETAENIKLINFIRKESLDI